jgi:hypothetical protein
MAKDRRTEEVARITTAAQSPNVDLSYRQRRYVISMMIRTLCFIGAVFAHHIPWLCVLLIGASFFLPYIAVVMANSAAPVIPGDPIESPTHDYKELR